MALNVPAFFNTVTRAVRTLPVVILYVTEECNLQCITCSYRKALPGELSLDEIRDLAGKLHSLGLRHIAYSGGEPLMRRDFPSICETFRPFGVKQTLLTNGLLLEKRLPDISRYLSEIVVSLDGADSTTHDAIRGAVVFERILSGIRRAVREAHGIQISLRTVVQKKNFAQVHAIVELGHTLGVHHVSFLASDTMTDAFGRHGGEGTVPDPSVVLDEYEAAQFRQSLHQLISTHMEDFHSGFIAQSPASLLGIAQYYSALHGAGPFPRNKCNAPMVSGVITSHGAFKPCFFLPEMDNVRGSDPGRIIDSTVARSTRKAVRKCSLETCRRCVCTLHVSPVSALLDRF